MLSGNYLENTTAQICHASCQRAFYLSITSEWLITLPKKFCVRTTRKSTWSGEVNVQLTSAIVSDPLRKDLLNPANLNQVDQAGSEAKHLQNKKNHNPSLNLNELNKACK